VEDNNKIETITINEIEYKVSDLSEECIAEITSAKFCDEEINRLSYQLAAIQTAKNAYHMKIAEYLPKENKAH
jgi:hypothetical protein